MQNEIVYLYLDDIIPNRFQPREVFDDEALKELAISIKEHGVIQPIIVRQVNNKYEIIAGERRYKASTMAGLTKIPAIIKNLDDKESSKVALIENLQRKDLTPIEEARTYQKILELENGMTQEGLAQTMGKTQSAVSNKLRLLSLPEEVQHALLNEQISERHARCLLNLEDKGQQIRLLDKVISTRMTVKELEKEIKMYREQGSNSSFGFGYQNVPDDTIEEKVIPYTATSSDLNPTEVDINRIRENSVDINPMSNRQQVNVNELMNSGNENSSDLKFVPEFKNDNEDNEESGNVKSINSNIFNYNSSNDFNNDGNINDMVPNNSVSIPVTNTDSSGLFGGIPLVNELPSMNFASNNNNLEDKNNNFGLEFNNKFMSNNLNTPDNSTSNNSPFSNFGGNVVNQALSDIPSMNINNNFMDSNVESSKPDLMGNPSSTSANLVHGGQSSIPDLMGGGLKVGVTSKATVMDVVANVRTCVKEIENTGFTVSIEELDIMDEYQILIKINKE